MKIAHIVCVYPPYTGGMGNVAFEMASGLTDLGHEVEVFTPFYSEFESKIEKEKTEDFVNRLKTPFKYGNAAYLSDLKKELNNFDIVHLHYPFFGSAGIVKNWKIKNPEKKLFITYHMDNRGDGLKGFLFKINAKFGLKRVLAVADKIQVTSFDYLKNSDAGKLFQKNSNVFFELPLGVDTDRFQPRQKNEDLSLQLNLSLEKPTILFVGGMDSAHYFKGVDILLKSLLILKKNNFDFQAIFVGDGNLREDYELKAKAFGLKDAVRFVGSISNEKLPFYYNLADLFVLPSINQAEAFGLVLLEAMASGVPVIASDLPGVRTVANDGGFLIKPGDYEDLAKKIFIYFSEDRQELKKQVREVTEEKYSWKNIIKKLEEEYKKVWNK
ncbi:MAG: glycosyltransferase family 4 protein [Patescibacteria group bacterium]